MNKNKEIKKIELFTTLCWIFGTILIVLGIVNMILNSWIWIFLIFSGILILPLLNNFLKKKMNLSLSKSLRIFMAIIFILVSLTLPTNPIFENKETVINQIKSTWILSCNFHNGDVHIDSEDDNFLKLDCIESNGKITYLSINKKDARIIIPTY